MSRIAIISKSLRALLMVSTLLVAMLLSGCSPAVEKSEFAGPDWSRGIKLGTASINNRAGVVWDSQTQSALVAWLANGADGWHFEYARVNDQGQVAVALPLPFAMRLPTRMQFVRDSLGGLHLFWLDSVSGARPGVYHAIISVDGAVLAEPVRLSDTASDVTGYSVTEATPGALDIFWADVAGGSSQLNHARMTAGGEAAVVPHSLGMVGSNPASATDSDGTVHLAWNQTQSQGAEQILYATFDSKTQQIGKTSVMAAFPMGTGLALHPPEIGLETGRVYIFWALEQRAGGLSPGTAETHYRSFPMGKPEAAAGDTLLLPALARPDYEPATSSFNYQALYYLTDPDTGEPISVRSPATYTYMHFPIAGQRSEVGLLVSSYMALPRRTGNNQVAFVGLAGGKIKGYEAAVRVSLGSLRPIAAADDQGGIHLVWLTPGGFGAYDVYYASTATSVRTALNRVTWEDVGASVVGRTWNTAAALSFFPMLVIWLLLPFAWLVGFYLFRPDSDLTTRTGRVALLVAIAIYLFSKLFMLPAFLWYAPFMDIISPKFEIVVLLGVPLLIMGLALLAMRAYIRRSDRKAVLFAFAIFAGIDSLLSLMLYMPNAIGG